LPQTPVVRTEQRPEPRSRKGSQTRERLISAAQAVFEESGFLNARISDISKRADRSHGVFYHYFDTKEEIFRAVAEAAETRLSESINAGLLDPDASASPHERIRAALRQHFHSYRDAARIMRVIEEVGRYDAELSATRAARIDEYQRRFAHAIQDMQRGGMANPELNPRIVAGALTAMIWRFSEVWLAQELEHYDFDEAVEQLTAVIAGALGLPPEAKPGRGRPRRKTAR